MNTTAMQSGQLPIKDPQAIVDISDILPGLRVSHFFVVGIIGVKHSQIGNNSLGNYGGLMTMTTPNSRVTYCITFNLGAKQSKKKRSVISRTRV